MSLQQEMLFVYLYQESSFNEDIQICQSYLNFVTKVSQQYTRPKVLIIFFKEHTNSTGKTNFSEILTSAWYDGFLNISVLEVSMENNGIREDMLHIYSYNPFLQTIRKESLAETENIFPYKLNNLYGYPLKIMFPIPLQKEDSVNEVDLSTDVLGRESVPEIFMASKKMNFSIDVLLMQETYPISLLLATVDEKFQSNSPEMLALTLGISNDFFKDLPAIYTLDECKKLVLLGPVKAVKYLHLPLQSFLEIIIISALVMVIIYLSTICGILSWRWRPFVVCQALLGVPTQLILSTARTRNRLIFLSVIFTSLLYSTSFYSKVLDIKLSEHEVSFDTFEELYKSNLAIYSNPVNYYAIFDNGSFYSQLLRPKVFVVQDSSMPV